MFWSILNSVATTISMVAFVLTAIYIRAELKALDKDRYLAVTNDLYSTWQSQDFMQAQLWLMHRLQETSWRAFIDANRGDIGEIAFHRVGAFYDRIGTLVRLRLIDDREILATMGGYAIAVWRKIGPLVLEARRIENSTLFADFERLLPACHECYVPDLGRNEVVSPFTVDQPVGKISPKQLKERLDSGEPITLVDVRHPSQIGPDGPVLPGAQRFRVEEVEERHAELPADREVVVYCA